MFGRTVFGDSATASDASVARPVDMSPSQIPINADAQQQFAVSQVDPNALTIGALKRLPPPGTVIGVDPRKPIDERTAQSIPISQTDPQSYAVPPLLPGEPGPGGPVSFEAQRWRAWLAQNQPGIFHTPPMAGPARYDADHRFGPPTLGASPDGLGAYAAKPYRRPHAVGAYTVAPHPPRLPPWGKSR